MAEARGSGGLGSLLMIVTLLAAGGIWLLERTVVHNTDSPDYSTLNDTPRGASVLHEALARLLPDVRRSFADTPPETGAVLFRIGEPLNNWSLTAIPRSADEAAFVAGGGRLVCAFLGWRSPEELEARRKAEDGKVCPDCGGCRSSEATTNEAASAAAFPRPAGSAYPRATRGVTVVTLPAALTETSEFDTKPCPELCRQPCRSCGISHEDTKTRKGKDTSTDAPQLAAAAGAATSPVPWHSLAVFDLSPEAARSWHTRYTLGGRPVMIETRFGKGSIVLASDCYFLSNEAMAQDRQAALVASLAGGKRSVVFDENVHGLRERRNTAWLLQRYRLGGVVAVVVLLVLLGLWRDSRPLLPRSGGTGAAADGARTGLRAEDGLVSLLRGHLPAAALPRHLFEAWRQSSGKAGSAEIRREMESFLASAETLRATPAATCRALYRLARRPRAAVTATSAAPPPPPPSNPPQETSP